MSIIVRDPSATDIKQHAFDMRTYIELGPTSVRGVSAPLRKQQRRPKTNRLPLLLSLFIVVSGVAIVAYAFRNGVGAREPVARPPSSVAMAPSSVAVMPVVAAVAPTPTPTPTQAIAAPLASSSSGCGRSAPPKPHPPHPHRRPAKR